MSRSYRRNPIGKDNRKSSKARKIYANRTYRRAFNRALEGVHKSTMHKRYYESWDIHDYVFRWTREEAIASWFSEELTCAMYGWDLSSFGWHRDYGSLEAFLNHCWRKCVYSK